MASEPIPSRAAQPPGAGQQSADPKVADVATWLGHFSRTLKTCRLYDAKNPTSIKFREDLGTRFLSLIEAHGAIPLAFSASEVRVDGQTVMAARSRDDNFAMPFYRDGLRTLTFQPGVTAAELDTVVDLVLRATGRRSSGGEDLVTLLWDADLTHVDLKYVSAQADVDFGDENDDGASTSSEAPGESMPWPGGSAGPSANSESESGAAPATTATGTMLELAPPAEALPLRSEDWLAGDPVDELETCYDLLEPTLIEEAERFGRELRVEREQELFEQTLELVRSVVAADLRDDDRAELSALVFRMLQESVAEARWRDACDTVECLGLFSGGAWDPSPLLSELLKPESFVTSAVVRQLDGSGNAELGEFIAFARTLGVPAAHWLMGLIARAEQERTRRMLLRPVSELCAGDPLQLASWLKDERWHVVRNAITVVGGVAGGAPPELLRPLLQHPEPAVRQELVGAIANLPPDTAQPLLLELLRDDDLAVRGAALHRLGARRSPEVAAELMQLVRDPGFRKRPIDEVRSVAHALGGAGSDTEIPGLEEQLGSSGWFGGGGDPAFLHAIARCIARIGTPDALATLERAAASRNSATRDACRLVLKGLNRG